MDIIEGGAEEALPFKILLNKCREYDCEHMIADNDEIVKKAIKKNCKEFNNFVSNRKGLYYSLNA